MPVKFAAVCGNAYKSFKCGGQLWLHNIFSVTHRITNETSLINLKLIKAYKYLVSYGTIFIEYSLALKIIWRLKNCCRRYLLERFIHSVLSKPALCSQERTTLFKMQTTQAVNAFNGITQIYQRVISLFWTFSLAFQFFCLKKPCVSVT